MVSHAYRLAIIIRDELTRVCQSLVGRNPQLCGLRMADGAVSCDGHNDAWDTYCGETPDERAAMAVAHNVAVFEYAKRAISVDPQLLDTFKLAIHFALDGSVHVSVRVADNPATWSTEIMMHNHLPRSRKRPRRSAADKAGPRIAKMARTLAMLDSEGRLK